MWENGQPRGNRDRARLYRGLPKGLKFERLTGGRAGVEALLQTKPTLMLSTYHLFPNIDDIIEKYLAAKDSFVFLDESHRIKGGSSKVIAASILKMSTVARGRLIMTGTRARRLAREGRKVIIWSSFVENGELIADRLADIGADFIHGGVEASNDADANSRETKIRRFHDDRNAMVLVANPAACSEGISLHTVCRNSIYVDRNFNAAQYIQSEDRIHRIGSDQVVTEEILVSPDTIDESVAARLEFKVNAMADVLNDESLRIDPISFDLDEADPEEGDIDDILRHLKAGLVSA